MTIVGRLTRDAVVNVLKDDRQVVNFSIAINDYYKAKGKPEGERLTTYINCSYWKSMGIAKHLTKGTLVEVEGRIYVNSYVSASGEAKASLKCYVNRIKIHGVGKRSSTQKVVNSQNAVVTSDVAFIDETTPF